MDYDFCEKFPIQNVCPKAVTISIKLSIFELHYLFDLFQQCHTINTNLFAICLDFIFKYGKACKYFFGSNKNMQNGNGNQWNKKYLKFKCCSKFNVE